jgi:predicted phosphodiesterase
MLQQKVAKPDYTLDLRVAWLTDIHLNFLGPEYRSIFYSRVSEEKPDALLVGGDIGEADTVIQFLDEIAIATKVPIYFVLGNHDFFRGSIADVRRRVTNHCTSSSQLHWLPATGVVRLTVDTALIGHDSWADGRWGDFFGSDVTMHDHNRIEEFRRLSKPELFEKLNVLGDEAATYLEARAQQALSHSRNVVVLTHPPPFREACFRDGQQAAGNYLPHYSCQAVGNRLAMLMRKHPHNSMTILCGHTHSPVSVQVLDNLSVLPGEAKYFHPRVQRVFEVL